MSNVNEIVKYLFEQSEKVMEEAYKFRDIDERRFDNYVFQSSMYYSIALELKNKFMYHEKITRK